MKQQSRIDGNGPANTAYEGVPDALSIGTRKLLGAVFKDALRLILTSRDRVNGQNHAVREAEAWLLSDEALIFSSVTICETFDIDIRAARVAIAQMRILMTPGERAQWFRHHGEEILKGATKKLNDTEVVQELLGGSEALEQWQSRWVWKDLPIDAEKVRERDEAIRLIVTALMAQPDRKSLTPEALEDGTLHPDIRLSRTLSIWCCETLEFHRALASPTNISRERRVVRRGLERFQATRQEQEADVAPPEIVYEAVS